LSFALLMNDIMVCLYMFAYVKNTISTIQPSNRVRGDGILPYCTKARAIRPPTWLSMKQTTEDGSTMHHHVCFMLYFTASSFLSMCSMLDE